MTDSCSIFQSSEVRDCLSGEGGETIFCTQIPSKQLFIYPIIRQLLTHSQGTAQ